MTGARRLLRSAALVLAILLAALSAGAVARAATPSVATPGAGPASGTGSGPAAPPAGSASSTQATDVATVARALALDPLYVSTAPGTPPVSAGDLRGALPPQVYVAVLPASAATPVGGEAAALPGALLGALQRPGTVLALVGPDLVAASRVQRADRLQEVLDEARRPLLAGQPTTALVIAVRDLTGSGQLSDAPSAARAGSPSGGGFLWVIVALVIIAVVAVPLVLRRARRPAPPPPPRVLRDRVEVDSFGRITRRVSAADQAAEQERRNRG